MKEEKEYQSLEEECLDKFGEFPGCYRLPTSPLTDKEALLIIENTNKRLRTEMEAMRELLSRYKLGLQQISGYRTTNVLPTPEASMALKALNDPDFGSDSAH